MVLLALVVLIFWEYTRSSSISGNLELSQTDFDFSIGAQIQEARLIKGFSLEDLSNFSGLSINNLQTIENNKAAPTRELIFKLQNILDIEILMDGN